MITPKQRRVAILLRYNFCYRTILKQIVKSSLLELSFDFVFENKSLTIWDGVREDLKRFFFMPEQKVHVKVDES